MFPRISDLFNYLFGTNLDLPVQTYGFFLALAFVIASFVLKSELKRKEKEGLLSSRTIKRKMYVLPKPGELLLNALISGIIFWKIGGMFVHYAAFKANPQEFLMSSQGWLIGGFLAAAYIIGQYFYNKNKWKGKEPKEEKVEIHPHENTWNILVIAVVAALVGSKLFDLFDNFSSFLKDPISSIFSFSGLTFYGGFIVTVITLLWYMKKIKLDWHYVIDAAAPAIMIGYAVGRLGCQFSGDGCWGIVNEMAKPSFLAWLPDWMWAFNYPHNVINEGIPLPHCSGSNCMVLDKPVFPTPIYESLVSFIWFLVLWFSRKKIKAPVVMFGLFLILNGIERFLVEKIRVNHKYDLLGMQLTQAEIISFSLFVIGLTLIIVFSRKFKKEQSDN